MQLITALATPFENGRIHVPSYLKLLERQQNADGVICTGTTAEHGMLLQKEKKLLIRAARTALPDKKIWAGIGGDTRSAVSEGKIAKRCGADGLMIAPPSFFKCTKEGFIRHISKIFAETGLPIMLYNAPSRCCYTLWQDAVETLASKGVCIKDAGNDLNYARALSKKLPLFCGNEELLRQFAEAGAAGVVSVVSNIAPNLTRRALEFFAVQAQKESAATDGTHGGKPEREISTLPQRNRISSSDKDGKLRRTEIGRNSQSENIGLRDENNRTTGEKKHINDYNTLAKSAFCEINPVPIKYMLYKEGIFSTCDMRLPLTSANPNTRKIIDEFWQKDFDR